MQHFLKATRGSQGQRSLRPSFSDSSFSPCTTRRPRLTLVSDGNPLRRLLLRWWKKVSVRGSLSFQMDLPVTSRKRAACWILAEISEVVGSRVSGAWRLGKLPRGNVGGGIYMWRVRNSPNDVFP